MCNILRCIFVSLFSIQFLWIAHCAPVSLNKQHKHGSRRQLTKAQENADKKSHAKKKTAISINGQFLPMAKLRTTDKDVHVTVQKANPTGVQLQPTVQEVSLGGQNPGTPNTVGIVTNPGNQVVGMSPGITTSGNQVIGMSPGITNHGNQVVGMSPGITNPGNQVVGMSPGITTSGNQVVGMSPGITNPGNQVVGMSPGITTSGNQVVGMSPGITNNANQALGMSPGISTHLGINGNNNGIPIQNLQNCDTNTLSGREQMLVHTNSNGELTYKPLSC